MYQYLDRPTVSLDRTSCFLLWAIRSAAGAMAGKRCLGAALGPGFARLGLDEALPHFAIGMAVLVREASHTIEVMTPGCCRVAEHEALLLALFTACDPDSEARVRESAGLLVRGDTSADTLARALRAVTAELMAHGLMPAEHDGAGQ